MEHTPFIVGQLIDNTEVADMRALRRFIILCGIWCFTAVVYGQSIVDLCPILGIQLRTADFSPQGIILTYFDGASLWVYDIGNNTRYPLPETVPCVGNCRLSPDATWITYLNPQTSGYMKMRLNGTERTPITDIASDVLWGDQNSLLVWTPDHRAYLQAENGTRTDLPSDGVISIERNGKWGVWVGATTDGFMRYLIDMQAVMQSGFVTTPIPLAPDTPYFNASSWSPLGNALAFVGRGTLDSALGIAGAELMIAPLDRNAPFQATDLTSAYGAVRIDGASPSSLAWSPDGTQVAYWVIELTGTDVSANTGVATIHITNINTRQTTRYCGFSTNEHTPNPPHLVWSSDSTHLAFGGNVAGDNKGYLLLTLNVSTGTLVEMSEGIFPALGAPDVLAWGNSP